MTQARLDLDIELFPVWRAQEKHNPQESLIQQDTGRIRNKSTKK
jgi:hypothetical protein